MRSQLRVGIRLVGLAVVGLMLACGSENGGTNAGVGDANFGDAPVRGVTNELPDGLEGFADALEAPRGVGSTPITGSDAKLDRAPITPPTDGGASPDAGGPSGGCSLVRQDCQSGRGCYPGPSGGGTCQLPGGFFEGMPCSEHVDCAPGLLCVEVFGGAGRLCEPICDTTAVVPCGGSRACRAFPGSLVGTCAP